MNDDRRLIEVNLPLVEVSAQSAREKSIRHGHISTLHIWWARRPLAACRAAVFATLMEAPEDEAERKELEDLIVTIVDWDQVKDGNSPKIEEAKRLIREQFDGEAPKVLDPFAGGGSIPLEAQRLGCEAHAVELNPVAHLIELCTLVYPQRYADGVSGPARSPEQDQLPTMGPQGKQLRMESLDQPQGERTLASDVERWGKWMLEQARAEIGEFYENPVGGDTIVAYLWARTVQCPNPSCGAKMPLVKQFWLRRKHGKEKVALKPVVDRKMNEVSFEIVRGDEIPDDLDPSEGTTSRGSATCLVCGQTVEADYVRGQGLGGWMDRVPLAVITTAGYGEGKQYRTFTNADITKFERARERLQRLKAEHQGPQSLVPDEPIPPERARGNSGFRVLLYGLSRWGQLFDPRQRLALVVFADKIGKAYSRVVDETDNIDYARAVSAYLALALDRLADYGSNLATWVPGGEFVRSTFVRQALAMVWDYCEVNPFSGLTGDWTGALDWITRAIEHCSSADGLPCIVRKTTASSLPYDDGTIDAVITDPPYYDSVAYADLSDFFYVWLKRSLKNIYPEVLRSPLTPKSVEIIEEPERHKDSKRFYEREMTRVFSEINRVLKPEGRAAVMFAHKSTAAWETLISGLLEAGLVTTASWPLHTERSGRLLARMSAALASSILLICKKQAPDAGIGYYDRVRADLEKRIHERLDFFWQQGIRGSDFFIAAIGPALEVFGQYKEVRRLSGDHVMVTEFLNDVRSIVTDYALGQVLHDGHVGAVDPATRFYVVWRWAYGNNRVPFDEALKLAQALGAEIRDLMDKTDLLRGRTTLRPWRTKVRVQRNENIGEPEGGVPAPLIDVIQCACVLWEREERVALSEFLNRALMGRDETFWSVAQSLSEILPDGNKEKQLLQGLLVSQDRLPDVPRQEKLL